MYKRESVFIQHSLAHLLRPLRDDLVEGRMMKIQVFCDWNDILKAEAEGNEEAVLAWEGEYRVGDYIVFSGLKKNSFYQIKIDPTIETSLVYVTKEEIIYKVPFYEKKESYNPLSFVGNRHYLMIRKAREDEIARYRNLALNPLDQHDTDVVFPHASANIETRGESVFAARNAIDGVVSNTSHGEWPYESWGINRRADAEFYLDFGRPVDIDRIVLYTRADFPHDSWWTSGTFAFSDGTQITVPMEKKTTEPHVFSVRKKSITSLKLYKLVKADDPSPFPALTQIEVYGTEAS